MSLSNKITGKLTGLGAIALAIVFNLPFSYLAQHFGYPDILRHPPEEVLSRFMAGGDGLIWAWYVFGLTALMFVPMGIALSVTKDRMQRMPALAVGAALAGLWRDWFRRWACCAGCSWCRVWRARPAANWRRASLS